MQNKDIIISNEQKTMNCEKVLVLTLMLARAQGLFLP